MLPDWDEFDRARWPGLDFCGLGALDQWRVLSALVRLDLAYLPVASTSALLRLWERGRRADAEMDAAPPKFVYAPAWVTLLLRSGEPPLGALADPELVAAAEAVVRMTGGSRAGNAEATLDDVAYLTAVRALLTAE